MPRGQFVGSEEDYETPVVPVEIMGRGVESRKSKTFFQDMEIATLLGFIRGHAQRLMELFRRAHAKHYTVEVEEEDEDGNIRTVKRPEVLTDNEVRDKYPVVREWERMHNEQVEHFASIGGFSVRAASGFDEETRGGRRRTDSSAGEARERRRRRGAGDVGAEGRWK